MRRIASLFWVACLAVLLSQALWAQADSAEAGTGVVRTAALIRGVIETVVYGLLGIVLAVVGYKVFDLITPFDLSKELAEDQNVAVGIVLGAMVLGICLIIALTILSP